jgi:hypothetical protein
VLPKYGFNLSELMGAAATSPLGDKLLDPGASTARAR